MPFNPDIHHRRSVRLKDYDYSQNGAYFVTLCSWQRESLYGDIVDGEMRLNDVGQVVESLWQGLPDHFFSINLDEFVIMPNHFHGIIVITNLVGAKQGSPALPDLPALLTLSIHTKQGEAGETFASPLHGSASGSLSAIIQNFKSISTRKVNKLRNTPGTPIWQRNYYERVIRNETELAAAREYIVNNSQKWELDKENPANSPTKKKP